MTWSKDRTLRLWPIEPATMKVCTARILFTLADLRRTFRLSVMSQAPASKFVSPSRAQILPRLQRHSAILPEQLPPLSRRYLLRSRIGLSLLEYKPSLSGHPPPILRYQRKEPRALRKLPTKLGDALMAHPPLNLDQTHLPSSRRRTTSSPMVVQQLLVDI